VVKHDFTPTLKKKIVDFARRSFDICQAQGVAFWRWKHLSFPLGGKGEEGARISPNILDFLGALSDMHKKREGATGSAAQTQINPR